MSLKNLKTNEVLSELIATGWWTVGYSRTQGMFHCTIRDTVTRWSRDFNSAVMKTIEAYRELERDFPEWERA